MRRSMTGCRRVWNVGVVLHHAIVNEEIFVWRTYEGVHFVSEVLGIRMSIAFEIRRIHVQKFGE